MKVPLLATTRQNPLATFSTPEKGSKKRLSFTAPPSSCTRSKRRQRAHARHDSSDVVQQQQQRQQETSSYCHRPPDMTTTTPDGINRRIVELFEDHDAVNQPCLSARLFASYSLSLQPASPERNTEDDSRAEPPSLAVSTLHPILRFLKALVHAEVVSLRDSSGSPSLSTTEKEQDSSPPARKHRKIHFSGFDCSSAQPPVDRVNGSAWHQQHCIRALSQVEEAVEIMVSGRYENDGQQVVARLEGLRHFLEHSTTAALQKVCAVSIPIADYPPGRFDTAVTMYKKEVEGVLARMSGQESELLMERRLAELVGRAIRYELRILLNPAPPRLSPADTQYEVWSKDYSQVHTMVEMVTPTKGETVVDSDRIASLFNLALDCLCDYFGVETLLDPSSIEPQRIPVDFCQSGASQLGVSIRANAVPLTAEQLQDVLSDVQEATEFLAVVRACRFVHSLLSVPGVCKEIEERGGWGEVETHASTSWQYRLWKRCPEDAHLVLLCNVGAFLTKITNFLGVLDDTLESTLVESLEALSRRFRTGTKSQKLLSKFPEILIVASHLDGGLKVADAFPTVSEVFS